MRLRILTLAILVTAVSGFLTAGARAGVFDETRSKLLGTWVWDEGEGVSRTETTYTFSDNGTFTKTVKNPGMPSQSGNNREISGTWRLETIEKGIKSLFDEANMLVLEYQVREAGTNAFVPTSSRHIVVISMDQTFGGKETLRLIPPDGSLAGTQYYFRGQ